MCGIAGIISPTISTIDREHIAESMHRALLHRGPDDAGVWSSNNAPITLAHRRLSIQDLSPNGHQPMASNTDRYKIVFNGEIYNFKTLRDQLLTLGHQFAGGSDTEVILAAVEEWGLKPALEKFIGMFAFALFDEQQQQLYLCRDRMGEKPLYYGWLEGNFIFASELKAITIHAKPIIDPPAMTSYMRFGYVPTPFSIYKNIFKLPPSTVFTIDVNQSSISSDFSPYAEQSSDAPAYYWSLKKTAQQGKLNPLSGDQPAIDELDALLKTVIDEQCIADVPIGAFLSGGVDSTTVAAIMQAVSAKPINTFTIGFEEKQFDEAPFASEIAKHIGSNHEELYISANDCLNLVPELASIWDEPFADSSQLPALLVSRMAKQHVTVSLSGDGGDELFCGYNRYMSTEKVLDRLHTAPHPIRAAAGKLIKAIPASFYDKSYSALNAILKNKRTQANIATKAHKLADILQLDDANDTYRFLLSYWQSPQLLTNQPEHPSILDLQPNPDLGKISSSAMYWDQLGYLVDDNLVKGDRASMAASLETRLPLLDHRVVSFSWRCNTDMRWRGNESKWILRQVLYRYVPRKLIERPKMGFSVPVGQWLRGPLKSWATDLICHDALSRIGLNSEPIVKSLNAHLSGKEDNANRLWTILMYLAWYQQNAATDYSSNL